MPYSNRPSTRQQSARVEALADALGYVRSGRFYTSLEGFESSNRHVIKQAFEVIGINAVFGFRSAGETFVPTVYLLAASSPDQAKSVHSMVWSQGVAPLLIVLYDNCVEVRFTLEPPQETGFCQVEWEPQSAQLPDQLKKVTAETLASSVSWREFQASKAGRLDRHLIDAIVALGEHVRTTTESLSEKPHLVNAVIGRLLYLYTLIDRNIITTEWMFRVLGEPGSALIRSIVQDQTAPSGTEYWAEEEFWRLFDEVDRVMNGCIFPIPKEERHLLSVDTLHLIHRVIRKRDKLSNGGQQFGFLDVSFLVLRTETISAIYEQFFEIESPEKKIEDGAFYTPSFLADYVVNEVDRAKSLDRRSRVLDPAAGSGIFLVSAYRRILEREAPNGGWKTSDLPKARQLLRHCVFGIEKNAQAANVARFSLYLTMLDYVGADGIAELARASGPSRILPDLSHNIIVADAFDSLDRSLRLPRRFSHVVGNPPWGTFGTPRNRGRLSKSKEELARRASENSAAIAFSEELKLEGRPVSQNRLSELFVWKCERDFLANGGVLGMLLSTRSFVGRAAVGFAPSLCERGRLIGIANFAYLRYKLFDGARAPALALLYQKSGERNSDHFWVFRPTRASQPIGQNGYLWSILVSTDGIETHHTRWLSEPWHWFTAIMLRPLDRRFAEALKRVAAKNNLDGFLQRNHLLMGRGGTPRETGIPSAKICDKKKVKSLAQLRKAETKFALSEDDFAKAKGRYKRLFSDHAVVISRDMSLVAALEKPLAFNSGFNLIAPKAGIPISNRARCGLVAYLKSNIARYFYSLFGSSWILDGARLEQEDLRQIPFPFDGFEDLESLADLEAADVERKIADQLKIGDLMRATIVEFTAFRDAFRDAGLPKDALSEPNDVFLNNYRSTLRRELVVTFGGEIEVTIPEHRPSTSLAEIIVSFGREADNNLAGEKKILDGGGFVAATSVEFVRSQSCAIITKSWARHAFTMDQAVIDASRVVVKVLEPA